MKIYCSLFLMFFSCSIFAQSKHISYKDKRDNVHLLGAINSTDLQSAPYKEWYDKVYDKYEIDDSMIEKLNEHYKEDIKVKIYLGTWCGDSKREVTRFLKIVDNSKINPSNVELICLDNREEHYKKGPASEEKGLSIHRVPTFIFYDNQSEEIGRIVEYPITSLEQDVAQVYAGLPSKPHYRVANYMYKLFDEKTVIEADTFITQNARNLKRSSKNEGELNTMGYVLMAAKEYEKAQVVFKLNTLMYPDSGNTFDSLAEAYTKLGDKKLAVENYMLSFKLNKQNDNAVKMIQELLEPTDKS